MSVEQNKALMRRYYDVCNAIKGDPDKVRAMVDEFYAPGFKAHTPTTDMDSVQHKEMRVNQYTAFPDLNWVASDMIAEGDKVVVRCVTQGTHKVGSYMGIPPTGKTVSVVGVDIFRIASGKFVEAWAFPDSLGLMQQLGVIPRR